MPAHIVAPNDSPNNRIDPTTGEIRPVAPYQVMPDLPQDDYAALKADIAEHGVLVPVETDEAGRLLDGHHRVRAWQELRAEGYDLPAYPVTIRYGMSEAEKRNHARRLNVLRRQLDKGQRDQVIVSMRADGMTKQAIAEATGVSYGTVHNVLSNLSDLTSSPVVGKDGKVRPAQYAPRSATVSGRAAELLQDAPEPVQDVVRRYGVADADTITELTRLHKQRRDTFTEVAASGYVQPGDEDDAVFIGDGALKVKDALRKKERTYRALALEDRREALNATPADEYRVIYADPPWRYEYAESDNRAIENHYPTLSHEEICELPVSGLAADDAVLFMWATSPKLAEAMHVMEAWGFNYRTSMVWVKDAIGMGYYARQRHELLLIATKGHPPVPAVDARPDSVQEYPRGQHSAKPEAFYELIERMYPNWPRIELFARVPREGWAQWGNEVAA